MNSCITLNNGLKMPILGLGTWKSKVGEVEAAVKKALEVGYRHIDCAYIYGNENEVGQGLKYAFEELKIARQDIFVTSKLWNIFHDPKDVEEACQRSLKSLGLDYLDLYLIHWPTGFKNLDGGKTNFPTNPDGSVMYEEAFSPTETYLALEKLVEKGLVKSIGLSNFNSEQIQDIMDKSTVSLIDAQTP